MTLYFTMPTCNTICFLIAGKMTDLQKLLVVIAAVLTLCGVGLLITLTVVIYSKCTILYHKLYVTSRNKALE